MKLTKKQEQAIKSLLSDLDELSNKPRRLFYALEEVAQAFERKETIPSIRVAQDSYYNYKTKGEIFTDLYRALHKFKIETWEWQITSEHSVGEAELIIDSAKDFADVFIRETTKNYK